MYDLREELMDAVDRNIDAILAKPEYKITKNDKERLDNLYELRARIEESSDHELELLGVDFI